VTYHAPQTKYWRNIITDSLMRVVEFMGSSGYRLRASGQRLLVRSL
jgi:hypothetical protein